MSKVAVAKALSFLWLGTVLTSLFALATQIILARVLGATEFGQLFAALAIINLVAPCVALGIPTFWLRVFGEEGGNANRWLAPSYTLLAISATCAISSLWLWSQLAVQDADAATLVSTLSPIVLAQGASSMLSAKYQIERKFVKLAIWESATSFFRFLMVVGVVIFLAPYVTSSIIAMGYTLIALFVSAYSMRILMSKPIGLELPCRAIEGFYKENNRPALLRVIGGSWKFGLSSLLYVIYYQIDVVMLERLVDSNEAGLYGAAYLVVGATYTVPGVVFQKYLLPKLHEWQFTHPEKLLAVLKKGTIVMAVLGIGATLTVLLFAKFALVKIFGESYILAVPILFVLALAIPFRFASTSAASILVSERMLVKKLKLMGFAACSNVCMNIFAIPAYGAIGAAWTTVATEAIFFFSVSMLSISNFGSKEKYAN